MGDTQLFLVRVWQHQSQFRASVRGVDEDEPRLFVEPEQVSEFLRRASAGVRDAPASDAAAVPAAQAAHNARRAQP